METKWIASRREMSASLFALVLISILVCALVSSILAEVVVRISPTVTPTQIALQPTATLTRTQLPAPIEEPTATQTVTAISSATSTSTLTGTPTSASTPTRTATSTSTSTITPTVRPVRVYLLPLRNVFALGASGPITPTQTFLYEGGNDVFEQIDAQGNFVRLQAPDQSLNFWTARENTSSGVLVSANYDYTVNGRKVSLPGSSVYACAHIERPAIPVGPCQQLSNVPQATLIVRISATTITYYLVEIAGKQYLIVLKE